MWSAERRFGLAFKEITGTVPVFHPDVRVWEVTDKSTGAIARCSIWTTLRELASGRAPGRQAIVRRTRSTAVTSPSTSNNNNFVKGAPGEPVLISLDDARTLFHEFGHALHSMLQNVRYRSLAGTPRDFVELPSQLNERWLLTREVLDRFARHYKTGEPMPQALVDKIDAVGQIQSGIRARWNISRRRSWTWISTRVRTGVEDMAAFEREALARIGGMPREIALRHRLPHFDHLFGSDCILGRVLQLPLVGRDGGRCLAGVRGGGRTLGSRRQ